MIDGPTPFLQKLNAFHRLSLFALCFLEGLLHVEEHARAVIRAGDSGAFQIASGVVHLGFDLSDPDSPDWRLFMVDPRLHSLDILRHAAQRTEPAQLEFLDSGAESIQ
tara:strand:- start:333 stop:656 length:324 start_codon:yes stop_codon:yes gene_type:complete